MGLRYSWLKYFWAWSYPTQLFRSCWFSWQLGLLSDFRTTSTPFQSTFDAVEEGSSSILFVMTKGFLLLLWDLSTRSMGTELCFTFLHKRCGYENSVSKSVKKVHRAISIGRWWRLGGGGEGCFARFVPLFWEGGVSLQFPPLWKILNIQGF